MADGTIAMADHHTNAGIPPTDPGIVEQTETIGCLLIADSGDALTVDVIHPSNGPALIRVAGCRLTPQEAAQLANLLLSAGDATSGAREGI